MDNVYALITGATGGLGKAFVYALAKQNKPLFFRKQNFVLTLEKDITYAKKY